MTAPAESGSAQFGIEFDYDVGRTLLTLHGELDALSVPAFAGVLHALAGRGARSVTIDLADLRFCNIGGLRAMADLRSFFEIDEPSPGTTMQASLDLDLDADRALRSSRPRAGSLHRASTGA